jgi:hypothetical protein
MRRIPFLLTVALLVLAAHGPSRGVPAQKPDDAAVARGQAFLIKTQREDGSWPMTSRPTAPGGKGSTSLIPITGAGSAWAVLGLVRSAGPAEPASQPPVKRQE